MNYSTFEKVLSAPRLNRYLKSCRGSEQRALKLYRLNIHLSQSFYSTLGLFEIALRNAIDKHYKSFLNDNEWLISSTSQTGMFSDPVFRRGGFETRNKIINAKRNLIKPYTHDRLVAALSFGFWVKLFDKIQFRVAGQSLHKVFRNRPSGTDQKALYKSLCNLRNFRNRIAHHEPICFNIRHEIDTSYATWHYKLLIKMTDWLGVEPKVLYYRLNSIKRIINKINALK